MEEFDSPGSKKPRITTIDAHIDRPWQYFKDNKSPQVTPEGMKRGGLSTAIFALYLSDAVQDRVGDDEADCLIMAQTVKIHRQYEVVRSIGEAEIAAEARETPVFLGLEGGRLIHNDIGLLDDYATAGIKYLTLTHNRNTDWADSATDKIYHGGLTDFGKKVIKVCNLLGVLVDVSHSSDETTWDVAKTFDHEFPFIASHSGCRELLNHPRNLSNELICEICEAEGVIHIPFARRFVGSKEGIANHIDHVAQLVGIDYVGVGSDLDGAEMVEGVEDVSNWSEVVSEGLVKKGYNQEALDKVMGLNTLRLL